MPLSVKDLVTIDKLIVTRVISITLSFDGGGGVESTQDFLFIFFLKNSLLDHTLRPTCEFLILAIFYHAKKNAENLSYKKFSV